VLDGDGDPVGTCFQVAPGVLVTACHVLDEVGAGSEDARVRVDPLAGGEPFDAVVAGVDPLRDLAVLTSDTRLPAVTGPLTVTDQLPLRALVAVTGHAVPDDPGRSYRFLTAPGEWAGGTTRDDSVPLGRMTSSAVVPGMSGAPVIRENDHAVVGVVSGRYTTADGWLAGTVWVARTEDLAVLLDGIADIRVERPPLAGPADLLLTVTESQVRLTGAGVDVAADHGDVRPGLAEAVNEVRRARDRGGLPVRADAETLPAGNGVSLDRVERLMGESFLPEPVALALGTVLAAAEREHQPVRFGVAVSARFAGLPWEALPRPDGRGPLALHPLVSVYRKVDAAPTRLLPGPLRIVVAIAAPDSGGGPVLDYERELRNVLAAVRAARQDAADVRVVPFATPEAIRTELDRGAAHVLHITGHGSPGRMYLENQDGTARPVSADEFVEHAVPAGKMPPVITLAACYTDAAGSQDGTSFAAQLCQHGATAVIATETSITDTYATRLLARVYGALGQASDPDLVSALSHARRQVQAELETSSSPHDNLIAGLGEWAAVTVLASSGAVRVLDPGKGARAVRQPSRPQIAGLAERDDWYFVGRRPEQRHWPTELTGPGTAGIVICGIGGAGKTTLAAELVTRVKALEPDRVLVSLTGPQTLESLLGAVVATLRPQLLMSGGQGIAEAVQALDVVARTDVGWQDRLAVLRGYVLDRVPVLMLLDNLEDNLRHDGPGYTVRDEVLGGLLAAWTADPGLSRLLITCRYRFALPDGAEQSLSFRQLGALSRAEAMKLAWSLPALDRLDDAQLEQVWRLAGGHPRSLEYLDALLSGGRARYPDVSARLGAAIDQRLSGAERTEWLSAHTGLDAALAETVALAADDVLLDDLLALLEQVPGAVDLLLGVSVYREPVDTNAVLFQAGQHDEAAERIPDRDAAYRQIQGILAAAGITADRTIDLAAIPGPIRDQLVPHLVKLNSQPEPPYRPTSRMAERIAACQEASLLTVAAADDGDAWFFVHRWTATELAGRAGVERRSLAHRQAAAYWQWRVRVWPQDKAADVHDLLEARYHLLQAGDIEEAGRITEGAVRQLDDWGAWDQEASLIHDTLTRLPPHSPRQAAWIGQLAILAQKRGDYDEASRQCLRSLDIFERLDNQAGMAKIYHQLGNIAYFRGTYDEALREYQRALDVFERLGNQADTAKIYHQLGVLAYLRGNKDEASLQYQRALDIFERLDDEAAMAISYHSLGALTQDQGDWVEAARQYQRGLDINERLGNQAGMASGYHQLGNLAFLGENYVEASRQYQRALDINERLGNQADSAGGYHQLGMVAQDRGDYDEAARQYQRALDIFRRLGNQAEMAKTCSALGVLAHTRGDPTAEVIAWHLMALVVRLRLGLPEAGFDLRYLANCRHELGTDQFNSILASAVGDPSAVEGITSLLDQFDANEGDAG
jgi:tetratricopeptide (TPR) repeat protein